MKKSLYAVLGLPAGASDPEIRSAYRRLVKIHHPDRGGGDTRFREIQEAYETLSDAHTRSAYDATLRRAPISPADAGMNEIHGYAPPFPSYAEVFQAPSLWPPPGRGLFDSSMDRVGSGTIEIVLTPEEAARGGSLSFDIPRRELCEVCDGTGQGFFHWCDECRGSGFLRRLYSVRFSVPPRVEHGVILTTRTPFSGDPLRARIVISALPHR